jgi:uncharacterized protein (TIGR00369 family)
MSLPDLLAERLASVAAPMVRQLGLRIVRAEPGDVTLSLPVNDPVVHAGGVLCGQAIMAAADTAMVVALCSLEPEARFRPMTTVQLNTSFLRPIPGDAAEVQVHARVLRSGRTLAYGAISFTAPDGKLAAHATTTYAYL